MATAALDLVWKAGGPVRAAREQRRPAQGHRPDGSLVSPSPRIVGKSSPPPTDKLTSGVRGLRGALRSRWHTAIAEGKLAAREKEAEVRAGYERRVQHDPRLHAQQLGRKPGEDGKK